jgi:hypothetical protein
MRTTWVGRRQAERRVCSIKAQARFYDGSAPSDCVVTDFSPTGARIVFAKGFEPPSAFDLHIPARADTRHALVRWRTRDAVGIEFSQSRGSSEDKRLSELLVRMSTVEAQLREKDATAASADAIAELAKRVGDLETRNGEIFTALDKMLGLLATLREDTGRPSKVA